MASKHVVKSVYLVEEDNVVQFVVEDLMGTSEVLCSVSLDLAEAIRSLLNERFDENRKARIVKTLLRG